MRAEVSSGTLAPAHLAPDETSEPGRLDRVAPLERRIAAIGWRRVERRDAHRDHLGRIAGLHGRERIAGVDVALEGVGADHGDDVGQLGDVEQGCEPRHHVLAEGRGRSEDRAVVRRQRLQQRHQILGDRLGVGGILDLDHPAHALHLGRGRGRLVAALAGDQEVDLAAQRRGGAHRMQRRGRQLRVVVLRHYQYAHQITFASPRSFSISSSMLPTLTPACRLAGSSTRRVLRRGVTSTPRSAGVS